MMTHACEMNELRIAACGLNVNTSERFACTASRSTSIQAHSRMRVNGAHAVVEHALDQIHREMIGEQAKTGHGSDFARDRQLAGSGGTKDENDLQVFAPRMRASVRASRDRNGVRRPGRREMRRYRAVGSTQTQRRLRRCRSVRVAGLDEALQALQLAELHAIDRLRDAFETLGRIAAHRVLVLRVACRRHPIGASVNVMLPLTAIA